MKRSNPMKRLAVMTLGLAAGYLAQPALAAPAGTIRVLSAAQVDAASPEAPVWQQAPAAEVALQPAFAGHGSIVGTPVTTRLTAQAIRSGDRLFVKLAWSDATANASIKDTTQFADGAAIEFPVNGKETTIPFMGDAKNIVNIWQWRADGRTQNLFAKGFGTATFVPFEGLHTAATRTHDGWAVVLARPLRVKPDEGANLQGRHSMPVAFAVWDGSNQERDGLKAVTLQWWQLRF